MKLWKSSSCFSFVAVCFFCLSIPCFAVTYTVNPNQPTSGTNYASLSALLSAVDLAGGDIVNISSGVTFKDRVLFTAQDSGSPGNPVIIQGSGVARSLWDGNRVNLTKHGYFWQFAPDSHDIEMRHIEIKNVTAGNNTRAVYILGQNITVRNCYVHHNNNGIFSYKPAYNTVVENCEVSFNGQGNGFSHNFYLQGTGSHLRFNYIHDANGGINYKDRSMRDANGVAVEFMYNWVENAYDAGYEMDFSGNPSANGAIQNAYVVGNVIIKSATGNPSRIIAFGTDSRKGTLFLNNNTIIAAASTNPLLLLFAGTTANLVNNIYYGGTVLSSQTPSGTFTGSHNWLMNGTTANNGNNLLLVNSFFGTNPGFTNLAGKDYRPVLGSAVIGAGLTSSNPALIPTLQYVKHLSSQTRTDNGTTLGAFTTP